MFTGRIAKLLSGSGSLVEWLNAAMVIGLIDRNGDFLLFAVNTKLFMIWIFKETSIQALVPTLPIVLKVTWY